VPEGADEDENVEAKRWAPDGSGPRPAEGAREHFDIGAPLGLDFESAQTVSGARFAYLRGGIARLNRALAQFMLDTHTEKFGYQEVNPPVLVRDSPVRHGAIAQVRRRPVPDHRWPLADPHRRSVADQPCARPDHRCAPALRFTALTLCFRSEAGAAGKDTRGLIRQHQFEKVEMVSITTPEESDAEHERMTGAAEYIPEALACPIAAWCCAAATWAFPRARPYDLKVWLPGQGQVSRDPSCSNCGDFRRAA
jgi:seryl-tRNA synthetase